MQTRIVLDPTSELNPAKRKRPDALSSLDGKKIGLLDISKARGDVFLDRIEAKLSGAGAEVIRYKKPTFTKPAPVDLRQQISNECDAVIEALAD